MSWLSTLLAGSIGWMLGGPLGALAGAALAHVYGKARTARYKAHGTGSKGPFTSHHERQSAFFVSMFTILGKLAKIDGQVSKEENDVLLSILDEIRLSGQQREFAIALFNKGKESSYSIEVLAQEFFNIAQTNKTLIVSFYDMLYTLAMADGVYHPAERAALESIRSIFRLDASYQRSTEAHDGTSIQECYAELGVSPNASNTAVKEAYRKKALEFHPDRIASKGLPEEFQKFAEQRFRAIKEAWDHIRAERNL